MWIWSLSPPRLTAPLQPITEGAQSWEVKVSGEMSRGCFCVTDLLKVYSSGATSCHPGGRRVHVSLLVWAQIFSNSLSALNKYKNVLGSANGERNTSVQVIRQVFKQTPRLAKFVFQEKDTYLTIYAKKNYKTSISSYFYIKIQSSFHSYKIKYDVCLHNLVTINNIMTAIQQ